MSLNYVKILAEKMSGNNQISFKYKSRIILITKKIGQFKSSFPYDLWYVNITWFMAANLANEQGHGTIQNSKNGALAAY